MSFDLVAATAYLTCGALMLFLGFVVLRENPRQRVNRATSGMLVFGGLGPILGAYGNLTGRSAIADGVAAGAPDAFAQFAFLWEFFFPSTLLFALVFPTLHPVLRRWPRTSGLLFVPHVFHLLLVMLVGDSRHLLDGIPTMPWATGFFESALGLLRVSSELIVRFHVRFFSFVNLAMAAASWTLLMRAAKRTDNLKLRAQVRMIRFGLGMSLALYSGGALVPAVFGLTFSRAFSLPLITVSLLVGAVSIVTAIVRLGFLDVRFIVRRGLSYGLASGVIVALYLFVGKQIDRVSAQWVGQQLPFFETTFLVLSLFLLQPVLSGIERAVDRTYSRDRSDLRNALTRLAEEVSALLDPAAVGEAVATTIQREMVLKTAAVVARDRSTGTFQLMLAGDGVERDPDWRAGPVLFEALRGRREPVSAAELVELPARPEDRQLLVAEVERLGAESAIPLLAATPDKGSEMIGVITLGHKVTETRITFEESALVSLIAHQVGISLMNSVLHKERLAVRLLEEEVATAREIQQQLLPAAPPRLPGWEICASNRPSHHVGGDYHDFLPLPGGDMGIAIGDVSGKGVPAALLMSNLQAALRGRVLDGRSTDRVVEDVNRQICKNTGAESFISFFLGELEPECGKLSFTNAGHNAPVLVRREGQAETLEDGGLLLGVFPEASYQRGAVGIEPGDFLALYTDGVTEASNPEGDLFSEERLVEALIRNRQASAAELHERVLDEVRRFQRGRSPDDDLTLILLKRSEESGGQEEVA